MTTFFIIVLFIAVVWLAIAIVSYTSQQNRKIEILEGRLKSYKDAFNESAKRGNEHFRAFKQLADMLGFCVHEERGISGNLAQFLAGGKDLNHTSKLVVHKKEADPKPRKVASKKAVKSRK